MEKNFKNLQINHTFLDKVDDIITGNWEKEKWKSKKFPEITCVD